MQIYKYLGILLFSGYALTAQTSEIHITANELAEMMDGTIQEMLPVVFYYRQHRSINPQFNSLKAWRAVTIAGADGTDFLYCNSVLEVLQQDQGSDTQHYVAVSKCDNHKFLETDTNSGVLESQIVPQEYGSLSLFQFFMMYGPFYFPNLIKGKYEGFKLVEVRQKNTIVDVELNNVKSDNLKFVLSIDLEKGALPCSIKTFGKNKGDADWYIYQELKTIKWRKVNDLFYPDVCEFIMCLSDRHEIKFKTTLEVLSVKNTDNLKSIVEYFDFMPYTKYYVANTKTHHIKSTGKEADREKFNGKPITKSLVEPLIGLNFQDLNKELRAIRW